MEGLKNLYQKAIKGEREAQYLLYRYCFDFLMPVCQRYHNNDQDSGASLNTAFYKILKTKQVFRDDKSFKAWCTKIAVNQCIDEYRKVKRREKAVKAKQYLNGSPIDKYDFNEAEKQLEAEDIRKLIRCLPEPSRTVFNMYAIDGYSHKEISEKLEIPEGTSKWYLHQSRNTLKEKLRRLLAIQKNEFYEKESR